MNVETYEKKYFQTRFPYDQSKDALWTVIAEYLVDSIEIGETVVDVGAGYGYFSNNVEADRTIALDLSQHPLQATVPSVSAIRGNGTELPLRDNIADTVFMSNVLEHLTKDEIFTALVECQRVLKDDGNLVVLTPNFALAPKQYFDDYTHKTILTHRSLADMIESSNFKMVTTQAKFLPFSAESSLPVLPSLVKLYLKLPFSPFAGQSLLVGTPMTDS